ncbi:hypothetical protein GUJ93_ZPchr0006g44489 [Zizania palustris]|uniref:Uncharacterized protein n=1 Tax=Zizania palustris TaxID=103762 RepID=A0A8J5SIH8_ZIZPA|nr:hypothetical protein GUJ93_ZPchr0006g44489 [Zizania palustris]KAG8075366.1 hypothetical protein GUJ93_ZPchr0006g44489 [Zizania palustris]
MILKQRAKLMLWGDRYSYPTGRIQCMLLQHGRSLTSCYCGTTRAFTSVTIIMTGTAYSYKIQMMRLPSHSSPCDGEAGPLVLSSSSIICSAILSSSSITGGEPVVDVDVDVVVTVLSLGVGWSLDDGAGAATGASLLSSTVMTQLESARAPARFCQTPMWDFSGSRRRQVSDGDGVLQHLRSLALRICDRLPPLAVMEDELPLPLPLPAPPRPSRATAAAGVSSPVALLETGKLVLALRPLIRMAASSYARAASSAVSKQGGLGQRQ